MCVMCTSFLFRFISCLFVCFCLKNFHGFGWNSCDACVCVSVFFIMLKIEIVLLIIWKHFICKTYQYHDVILYAHKHRSVYFLVIFHHFVDDFISLVSFLGVFLLLLLHRENGKRSKTDFKDKLADVLIVCACMRARVCVHIYILCI